MRVPYEVREYIQKLPPESQKVLSKGQEVELFQEYYAGHPTALERIIRHNLRLVLKFVLPYQDAAVPIMDLIQEGNIGLMEAAKRFDVTKDFRFSTYAIWWIRRGALRSIAYEGRFVRIPEHVQAIRREVERAERDLQTGGNLDPSDDQIFHYIRRREAIRGLSKKGINNPTDDEINAYRNGKSKYTLEAIKRSIALGDGIDVISLEVQATGSLDTRIEETIPSGDIGADEDTINTESNRTLKDYLRSAIYEMHPDDPEMAERNFQILLLRYGLVDRIPRTLQEISNMLNLSRERIRQVQKQVITHLGEEHPNLSEIIKHSII